MTKRLCIYVLAASFHALMMSDLSGQDLEKREAELASVALAKQNDKLKIELDRLKAELKEATVEVAQMRVLVDRYRIQNGSKNDDRAVQESVVENSKSVSAVRTKQSWTVAEANEKTKLIVLNGGKLNGLLEGMRLRLIRGQVVVATIRVVDVREGFTGAVVEEYSGIDRPEKGDRAELMAAQK